MLVKNESVIMPFFMRHYERFADLIIACDNSSSDGTHNFVVRNPKGLIRSYDTGGVLKDGLHRDMKSGIYKTLPGDWFIVVDCDEFIWHPDMRGYLKWCESSGITLPQVEGYNMIGPPTGVPIDDGKSLLTDLIPNGVRYSFYDKKAVIHKDVDINYMIGCHYANPTGRVVSSPTAEIKLLHYYWLSEEYRINRTLSTLRALSKENVENNWGSQPSIDELRETYRKSALEAKRVV